MLNFTYHLPTKIYFGQGQIQNIAQAVTEAGGTNILIVYGGGSIKKSGLLDKIIQILTKYNIRFTEFGGIDPNPRITSVRQGAAICKDKQIDLVIGIGGGSSVDAAKAIAAGACYDGDTWDLFTDPGKITQALPIITVLTLAATGSEMNHIAVVTNEQTHDKIGTRAEALRPKASFMDPTYTFSVNKYHTASGTADIMAHTLENYFSRHTGGYLQDRLAEALLKTCIHYGPIAYQEPDNYEARANLMWAGTWAINGLINLGKADPWTCHSIDHQLGAYYDITHGAGLAIIYPHWMEYILNENTLGKFYEYGVNVWELPKSEDKTVIAQAAIAKTREFFCSLGLPAKLSEVNIPNDKFELMAEKAATPLLRQSAYVPLDKHDILKILQSMA